MLFCEFGAQIPRRSTILHPCPPGVAAADYISTSTLPLSHPFEKLLITSANKIALRSCDIFLGDFSQMLLVLFAVYWMRMGRYIGILAGVYPSSNLVDSSGVPTPTADAVATGEVNCYNFIAGLRPLPRFAETISQGYTSQHNDTWLTRMQYCVKQCSFWSFRRRPLSQVLRRTRRLSRRFESNCRLRRRLIENDLLGFKWAVYKASVVYNVIDIRCIHVTMPPFYFCCGYYSENSTALFLLALASWPLFELRRQRSGREGGVINWMSSAVTARSHNTFLLSTRS